jgi:hypothetical protein
MNTLNVSLVCHIYQRLDMLSKFINRYCKPNVLSNHIKPNEIIMSTLHTISLLNTSVDIAKFVHTACAAYDSERFSNYHNHFVKGISPQNQTNNCLIIEGCHGTRISTIHTPLGQWTITGNTLNDNQQLTQFLINNIEMVMICPIYQTYLGTFGPYWLIKNFRGKSIMNPDILLLPESEMINVEKYGCGQLIPYLEQREKFYKSPDYQFNSDIVYYIFEYLLHEWITTGRIRDTKGISRDMLDCDKQFNNGIEIFKTYMDKSNHELLEYGSKQKRIFEAIYISKLNHNGVWN